MFIRQIVCNTNFLSKLRVSCVKRCARTMPFHFTQVIRPSSHPLFNRPIPKCTTFPFHYSSQLNSSCWKCESENAKGTLFCKECNVIQKPDLEINFFDIFGIEQSYELKVNELITKYRKLQNILHPDRFSKRHQEEIEISEEYSSLVNKAYATLNHPLSRGVYILKLNGIIMDDQRGTLMESSPQLLQEIMEKNEEVDDAQGDLNRLDSLDFQNKATLAKIAVKVGDALKTGNLKQAEKLLIKMRYYASIDSKIKNSKRKGFT